MLEMEIIKEEENQPIIIEQCRFCFEETEQEDLFVPCMCSGTARFVHRHCLQEWRSQDINSINYTRCQECLFDYEMRNQITFFQRKWIKICKTLSTHYFFMFIFILGVNIGFYYLFKYLDRNGSIHSFLNLSENATDEYMFLSTLCTVTPLFLIILIHDIFIYFKYRLHTYFDNYAGYGCKIVILWITSCIFLLSFIWPVAGWILLSILFQKIFKHMLERHYYRHITESSYIVDQIDNNDLHINIV
jgi:hypothetical protein